MRLIFLFELDTSMQTKWKKNYVNVYGGKMNEAWKILKKESTNLNKNQFRTKIGKMAKTIFVASFKKKIKKIK